MRRERSRYLDLTAANVQREHLCCAIAGREHQEGVDRKRAWLLRGFAQGLVFRKLDVQGKVFIEFAPAEAAWRPVLAAGYLVIHCLWVSGRYKQKGFARELLESCVDQVGERNGVVAVTGPTPYLTPTKFFLDHGFEVADQAKNGFELVWYRARPDAVRPRFTQNARHGLVAGQLGVHFEWADQCPFVPGCMRNMAEVAREMGLRVSSRHLETVAEMHSAASPFGTFGVFLDGQFLTHEPMAPAKFRKLLTDRLASRA